MKASHVTCLTKASKSISCSKSPLVQMDVLFLGTGDSIYVTTEIKRIVNNYSMIALWI